MYIPDAFRIEDPHVIREFLETHPFGTLLLNGADGFPLAVHLPFWVSFEGENCLVEGHLAKVNPMAQQLQSGRSAKVIIQGEHGYVSSSVYGHINVPTYNYQAAHLFGVVDLLSDEALAVHLANVVHAFENGRSQPLNYAGFPEDMLAAYRKEIVGFRLTVFKTEVAFKLSQNRQPSDFDAIVNDLEQGTVQQQGLAKAMKKWGRSRE